MKILGIIASSILKKINDTFTRTTSGSLGTSSSGNLWNAITGVWYANGTQAQSDTSVSSSSVAIAGFSLGPNVTATASVTLGTGIAFWVTDAGSWWAADSYSTQTGCSTCYDSCSCSSCNTCQDCSTVYDQCCTVYSCSAAGYSNTQRSGTDCYNRTTGAYQGPAACVSSTNCNPHQSCGPSYACAGYYDCNPHSCNCSTNYYLQLLSSSGGTFSEATGKTSLTSAAAAISVTTSGDSITAKAYSNTDMSTQLGSTLAYTATSPTKGSTVGIIKVPSSGQGSTIDNFTAQS